MIQVPMTLDQIFGTNFKKVSLLYGSMEGSNEIEINESDEDLESEMASREQKKRYLPPVKVERKILDRGRQKAEVSKSPVFQQHIGFRNSFYKNNQRGNQWLQNTSLGSRQRIQEIKSKEAGLFTKYAQRFHVVKQPEWN